MWPDQYILSFTYLKNLSQMNFLQYKFTSSKALSLKAGFVLIQEFWFWETVVGLTVSLLGGPLDSMNTQALAAFPSMAEL
jgi:hypothetical protein